MRVRIKGCSIGQLVDVRFCIWKQELKTAQLRITLTKGEMTSRKELATHAGRKEILNYEAQI